MARIKRKVKYSIIFTLFFMFYFIFISKSAVYEELNTNNNIVQHLPIQTLNKTTELQNKELNQVRTEFNLVGTKADKYIFDMTSPKRLNKLFDIIYEKEKKIEQILRKLKLVVFSDLVNYIDNGNRLTPSPFYKAFDSEIKEFLQVIEKRVRVTSKFVEYLYNQSELHTFYNPRKSILKQKINNVSI